MPSLLRTTDLDRPLPTTEERVLDWRRFATVARRAFLVVAALSVFLTALSGWVDSGDGSAGTSIAARVGAVVVSSVVGAPTLILGPMLVVLSVWLLATGSVDEEDDKMTEVEVGSLRMSRTAIKAIAAGCVLVLIGSTVYSVTRIAALMSATGLDGSPAVLVSGAIEGTAWLLLGFEVIGSIVDTVMSRVAAKRLMTETSDRQNVARLKAEIEISNINHDGTVAQLLTAAGRQARENEQAEAVERIKFEIARGAMENVARLKAEREIEIERMRGEAEFRREEFDARSLIAQIDADTAALDAGAEQRAALAAKKQADMVDLHRDRHDAEIGRERKRSKLLPTGGDADPKAPGPDPTTVMPQPLAAAINGHGLNGNGTTG